jgi:phosphotransferase system enzyme I (PtsI)
MLRQVVEAATRKKIPVGVCGEMAGDPVYAPLLLGMGVTSLSMTPMWLPTVKFLVRSMKMADARQLASEAMRMSSPKEIYAMCDAFYRKHVDVT